VAAHGFTPATWIPAASEGRAQEATIRPARVVEPGPFIARPVGAPEPWPGVVGFLDGTQRYEVMAYASTTPVVVAEISAAVMERRDRRLNVAVSARRRLVLARPSVLAEIQVALDGSLEGYETVVLPEELPSHPVQDFQLARREIDLARGRLEVAVGNRYREHSEAWLIVDGTLTESPHWAADQRMLAVAKSHATLPFEGTDLETYLHLPVAHRSLVFQPAGHEVTPVFSWALRLWPWEGHDILHGLIRIEAAPTEETVEQANQLSRWLLAERSPVSTPDPRWDRLLYGIRSVEEYLRSSGEG
jgi:hypothetical protein